MSIKVQNKPSKRCGPNVNASLRVSSSSQQRTPVQPAPLWRYLLWFWCCYGQGQDCKRDTILTLPALQTAAFTLYPPIDGYGNRDNHTQRDKDRWGDAEKNKDTKTEPIENPFPQGWQDCHSTLSAWLLSLVTTPRICCGLPVTSQGHNDI